MSLHVIIDGYNVIRQSNRLSILDLQDIQEGREGLQVLMAAYRQRKGHKITIVFDGTHASHLGMQRHQLQGMQILFSRNGETADDVIKQIASKEGERALIVSSDRDITSFAAARGAATIGAKEFEHKVFAALYENTDSLGDHDDGGWRPTTRKKGPSRRLPKRRRRNNRKLVKL
jgi:predicted RNA-binding protein with PIN domain